MENMPKDYQNILAYIEKNYISRGYKTPNDIVSNGNGIGKLKKMPRGSIKPIEMDKRSDSYSKEVLVNKNTDSIDDRFYSFFKDLKDLSLKTYILPNRLDEIINKLDYPKKEEVILLALGLNLNFNDAMEFISYSGYRLYNHKKEDVIVKYFLENQIYDCMYLNQTLEYFNLKLLF